MSEPAFTFPAASEHAFAVAGTSTVPPAHREAALYPGLVQSGHSSSHFNTKDLRTSALSAIPQRCVSLQAMSFGIQSSSTKVQVCLRSRVQEMEAVWTL